MCVFHVFPQQSTCSAHIPVAYLMEHFIVASVSLCFILLDHCNVLGCNFQIIFSFNHCGQVIFKLGGQGPRQR